jgi:ankyrin repeat protein
MWALTVSEENDLNLPVIEALLDGGADVNGRNNRGMTPLMVFIESSADMLGGFGKAEAVVKVLIDKGSDVKTVDNSGKTVLMWAKGQETIRRLLKQAGAEK